MADSVTVQEGDCCSSLAASHGFGSYHDVYDDGSNAALKKQRPNPNMLVAGDVVQVPDLEKKKVGAPATQKHKFVIQRQKVRLRIVLIDQDDKKIAKPWKLTVGGQVFQGTTGADGLIEAIIDPTATTGSLLLDPKPDGAPPAPPPSTPPPPPPAPPAKPPPYPLPIVEDDFTDKETDYLGENIDPMQWALSIGGLPSPNDLTGAQVRLENLGFSCGGEIGVPAVQTQAAVSAYQKKYGATVTGKVADVQDAVRDKHDKV